MIHRLRARALGLGGAALLATPTGAAPIEFGGTASVNVGYAINPFLQAGRNDSALSVGGNLNGTLTKREANAVTSLTGTYNRSEYLNGDLDPSDSFSIALDRNQTFSERLSGSLTLAYDNSRNSFAEPDEILDTTTLGARRKSYSASGSLQWQATERDVFSASASATKADYGSPLLGDFDSYSGSLSYRRVVNSRMNVGASMSISQTNSDVSGDTTTYSPRGLLDYQFNEAWKFNGSLGLLIQKTDYSISPLLPAFRSTSKGVGFDATLCRQAPQNTLCFTANRDTSASGFGGARTATSLAVTYTRQLSARDSISGSVNAVDTKSVVRDIAAANPGFLAPKERYYSADLSYRRTLSRRFDGGLGASYRRRDLRGIGDVDGFNFTLNLIARFGRLR